MRIKSVEFGKRVMRWMAFILTSLFLAFCTNAYMPAEWDQFSEGLVIGRLYQLEYKPEINPHGFLVAYGENYDAECQTIERRYIEGEALQAPSLYTHSIGASGRGCFVGAA